MISDQCGLYKTANVQCYLFSLISVVELEQSETKMKFLTVFTVFSIAAVGPISAIPGLLNFPSQKALNLKLPDTETLKKSLPQGLNLAKVTDQVPSLPGMDTVRKGATDLSDSVTGMTNGVTEKINDAATSVGITAAIGVIRVYALQVYTAVKSYVARILSFIGY